MLFARLEQALAERREQGLFREQPVIEALSQQFMQVAGTQYLNFSGNDYLGLAQAPELLAAQPSSDQIGSTGSPLVTGHSAHHQALCKYLAEGLGRDQVLLFSSGFAANQAICHALMANNGGKIVCDRLMHASLIEAAMHSTKSVPRFRHNNLAHAQQLLSKSGPDTLLVTEGIFSMDGDAAPVTELQALCQQHQAHLMLDDAHGMGVLGAKGLGTTDALGLSQQQVPILMSTFGKALGCTGAMVAGSHTLIDYLRNFSRHYIYSTAMTPGLAQNVLQALLLLQQQPWRRAKLEDNIGYFRQQMQAHDLPLSESLSAIQPVIIGEPKATLNASQVLKEQGIWVTAIRSPTVAKHSDRLRVTLSTLHDFADIDKLVLALKGIV